MKAGIDYPGVSVAFFCHDGDGNFLFHKRIGESRSHVGTYDCGGGGVELGETLEEAMFRELKEEYACTGVIEEVLTPNTFLKEEDGVLHHWVVHPYIVKLEKDAPSIGEPHKAESLSWHPIEHAPQPLHPGVAEDLETYKEIFKKYS